MLCTVQLSWKLDSLTMYFATCGFAGTHIHEKEHIENLHDIYDISKPRESFEKMW